MKVLIVTLNYPPEQTGIGKYVGEMCEWLTRRGASVRVVSAPPYYPAWRVSDGYSGVRYRREDIGNVVVYRCPLYVPKHPGGLRRILHLLSFAVTSFPVIFGLGVGWRPTTVLVIEPPLACAPAALLAAGISGARAWLHVQDFEVDAAFELGILKNRLFRTLALGLERWLMRRFNRVSSISENMVRRLLSKGVAEKRSYLFANWVDFSFIRPISGPNALRAELGLSGDAQVVLYSGNLGAKQGLEMLPEVARRLKDLPEIVLLICGDGPALGGLKAAAAGLENLRLIPLQPWSRLNELMALASVHVLPQKASVMDLVMPSKLITMMASGRPVVAMASAGSEVARVLDGVGRVVAGGDSDGMARAILELLAMPDQGGAMASMARERALGLWEQDRVLANAFGLPV